MMFFAPLDQYPPAGMFTMPHLVAVVISFTIVGGFLFISRRISWESVTKVVKILAILITVLELIKIVYNFYFGYTWLDAWFPLSYCSLFIYALWFSGYGKGILKRLGDAYLIIGAVVGGFGFLLLPTTSLMRYPIWHYLCLYSLFFHMTMIYVGVMYLKHYRINRLTYLYFTVYFLLAAGISIGLNIAFGSNIMVLRDPFNVPFAFIHEIKAHSQAAYTLLAMMAYLVAPIIFSVLVSQYLKRKKSSQV